MAPRIKDGKASDGWMLKLLNFRLMPREGGYSILKYLIFLGCILAFLGCSSPRPRSQEAVIGYAQRDGNYIEVEVSERVWLARFLSFKDRSDFSVSVNGRHLGYGPVGMQAMLDKLGQSNEVEQLYVYSEDYLRYRQPLSESPLSYMRLAVPTGGRAGLSVVVENDPSSLARLLALLGELKIELHIVPPIMAAWDQKRPQMLGEIGDQNIE